MRSFATILVAAAALADPPAPKDEARDLLRDGVRYFEVGRYQEALDKFVDAYHLYPSPKLLRNIGATYREMGRPVEALEAYERFMREGGQNVSARERAQVARDLYEVAAQVGELRVEAPPNTEVKVDGLTIGLGTVQHHRVAAGTHRVTLMVPDRGSFDLTVQIVGRKTTVASVPATGGPGEAGFATGSIRPLIERAVPAGAQRAEPFPTFAEQPSLGATAPEPPPERPFYARWPFWAGVGVLVAGGVIAATLGAGAGGEATGPAADDTIVLP